MRISATIRGLDALRASLGADARQIPFATALALNATARTVKAETLDEMRAQFDRPTPFTMKSLFILPAKPTRQSATVYLKDWEAMKNRFGMDDMIGHQFTGGTRKRKAMENALAYKSFLKTGEYVVPGPDAKLDQYGNLSRGQTQQIYAALRIFFDPLSNATRSARSRRHARAAGRLYWSNGDLPGALPRGLWGTDARGWPKSILKVIRTPVYRRRIHMDQIVARVVERDFDGNFREAIRRALASARR